MDAVIGPDSRRADVVAFFERYAALYMAGDAQAVADIYEAPFLAVRGGTPIHLADRSAVVEHLSGLMTAYRNSGAASADVDGVDVVDQGDSALLASVHWVVRTADGGVVRDFRTSYQLVGRSVWRILSYINHDTAAA